MTIEAAISFQFTTKARNLAQLEGRLRSGKVLAQHVLTVGEWRRDRRGCTAAVSGRFAGETIIVRSSAPGEDSVDSSMAGAFESIGGVPADDPGALVRAIEHVIGSYEARTPLALEAYEILVQPMVAGVRASGVVFTRDLEKNGPYYVINYDDQSDRTDTVTAGTDASHKVVRIFKGAGPARLEALLQNVVRVAEELERLTGSDAIDIEFAVDQSGTIYVLQVRPLSRTRIFSYHSLDSRVSAELRTAREFVTAKSGRRPHLFGETTIFGEMPDWNPAEMIGTQPKPLAVSLYRHIILKSVWREARELVGYRHPFPHHLLVEIAGRPYIDVRCSFNSFLPSGLRDDICERLVNHYLDELRQHPEYHDKVEFEIVVSCLSFDFGPQAERLSRAGFSREEIESIRAAARTLTDDLVNDRSGVLARLERDVAEMSPRRERILKLAGRRSVLPTLVEQLLEDCIRYGTLPFSVFARCAFVATSFLRSLVSRGALTPERNDEYLHSIQTVAGEFVQDLDACRSGTLDADLFLARYGHLRPGTYDITAPTYAERPELYLGISRERSSASESTKSRTSKAIGFPADMREVIKGLISESAFTFDVDRLNRFIARSIQLRESVKFEFTKNLSASLSLIGELGRYHGLSRDSLAFVPIERFLELANRNVSDDWIAATRAAIDANRKRYELTSAINLPDLIFSDADVEVVSLQTRRPNFITQKRVVAASRVITTGEGLERVGDLAGCIVLIENADPGYDWLFTKGIGGLVTKYGGAASHMTIRCAEFGLPAAIGCGEQIFTQLAAADTIILDCAERRVKPNAV